MSSQDDSRSSSRSASRDDTRKGRGRNEPGRRERIRREDPERQEPHRGWQGWFQGGASRARPGSTDPRSGRDGRRSDWEDRGQEGREPNRNPNPMDTVERGVKMAYQVVEDYIDQGRQAAQRINRQQYGPREMTDDFQALTERMMRDSTRFVSLWFEMMSSMWGMGMGMARGGFPGFPASREHRPGSGGAPGRRGTDREDPRRSGRGSGYGTGYGSDHGSGHRSGRGGTGPRGTGGWDRDDLAEPPGPRPSVPAQVTFDVRSEQPTQVVADLPQVFAGQPLHVTPLHAVESNAPPLQGMTFEPGRGAVQPALLSIELPPDLPAGSYHGTLVDPESHRSRGTVTVIVGLPKKKVPAKRAPKKTTSKKTAPNKTAPNKSTSSKKSPAKKGGTRKSSSGKSGSKESR